MSQIIKWQNLHYNCLSNFREIFILLELEEIYNTHEDTDLIEETISKNNNLFMADKQCCKLFICTFLNVHKL